MRLIVFQHDDNDRCGNGEHGGEGTPTVKFYIDLDKFEEGAPNDKAAAGPQKWTGTGGACTLRNWVNYDKKTKVCDVLTQQKKAEAVAATNLKCHDTNGMLTDKVDKADESDGDFATRVKCCLKNDGTFKMGFGLSLGLAWPECN